jgi:dipeptidyl aminopeptidase/acylaminoacyl peptidase
MEAANRTEGPLSFFVVLGRKVTAVSDGRGEWHALPCDQEEWGTAYWYADRSRLKTAGGTRLWGYAKDNFQVWYAALKPLETRTLVLETGAVSPDEAAARAAYLHPVVSTPPPPTTASNDLSHLCVLSPEGGEPREVASSPDRWECPTWTPDRQGILFSSNGQLWRLPLAGGRPPAPFPTGTVKPGRDYAFSADGKRLAIISNDAIFVMPAGGGEPTRLLPPTQGYVHGWSPDGKYLVYCAARNNGPLTLYRKPVDGGDEARLTADAGNNDAPEYSPDGKWIYFTSARGGRMSVWRMPADGAGPNDEKAQRVTNDYYEDWFPHPSPDGKWLVFLSCRRSGGGGAPTDQDVVLRVAPLPGDKPDAGPIREVARLTGGQGTINAPCWSPDGKSFAFVRYVPKK